MMKHALNYFKVGALACVLTIGGCKKDNKTSSTDDPSTASEKKYVLVIDNGAQAMDVGQSLTFSAHLVSSTGEIITPSGVAWSSNVGGFSGNIFSLQTETVGLVTASVDYDGKNYQASVPVSIQAVKSTQAFAVVPSAIIWQTNSGPIQLNTVYLGTGSSSYAFSSDNSGVANVSSTGLISFNAVGNTVIKVSATINGQTSVVNVPVLVVGAPDVPLPVTRVVVTPALGELFRGETLALSAKAYNSNGDDVTSTVTFSYVVVPKKEDDNEPAVAVSVNSSGVVKAETIGSAYVKVTANGVMGQSEIIVNPDTVIMVNPFYASLGGFDPVTLQPGPNDVSFTATTYKVDRAKYKSKTVPFTTTIPNPSGLQWELPLTGVAQIDDMFKVVTLSQQTNSSCLATRIAGKAGSTFVVAHAGIYGGAAGIMVNP